MADAGIGAVRYAAERMAEQMGRITELEAENARLRAAAQAVLAYVESLRFADDHEPVKCYLDLRAALANTARS